VVLIAGGMMEGAWLALPIVVALGVVPLLDSVFGVDERSPSNDDVAVLEAAMSFRIVLYLYVLLQTVALLSMCNSWSSGDWTTWECALAIVATGIVTGGIGITIAHELGHRTSWLERMLGYVLLAEVGYMHFVLEHVHGHHRNVGLPEDPATARRGEPAYAFVVRSAVGQWLHAWGLEKQRLRQQNASALSMHNRMIGWMIVPVLLLGCAAWMWGVSIIAFLVGQSLVAISLLELVNYIEHYGLVRTEIKPGVRDRVRAVHAWESRFVASNAILFKLQRHADHHLQPQRRYQSLRLHDESPQLPHGYPMMIMIALVPPLWRRLIHPRLDAVHSA
jgi:alkane 1-monooxygenase